MARQITILETCLDGNNTPNTRYAFWFAIAAGQQTPAPAATSAIRGITAAEIASLQSGATVEETGLVQYPAGTSLASIESDLQSRYSTRATARGSFPNVNVNYGTTWDGTTWVTGAVQPANATKYATVQGAVAAAGDNNLLTGTAGQVIRICRMIIIASAAVTVSIKDGAGSTMFGPFGMVAGVPLVLEYNDEPWFVTGAGNNLILNLGTAVSVAGKIWYVKG